MSTPIPSVELLLEKIAKLEAENTKLATEKKAAKKDLVKAIKTLEKLAKMFITLQNESRELQNKLNNMYTPGSLLALSSVQGVLLKIKPEQWPAETFVRFATDTPEDFIRDWINAIQQEAGHLSILKNTRQRMLKLQDKTKKNNKEKSEAENNLLINVSADGRFVITTNINMPTSPPTAILTSPAAVATTSTTIVTRAPNNKEIQHGLLDARPK